MPQRIFGNNATTTLGAALGPTDFTITVADSSVFPAIPSGDFMIVTAEDDAGQVEHIKITAIPTGTTLTVEPSTGRGQEGTSAGTFASGDRIELRLTAGMFDDVKETFPNATAETDANETISGSWTFSPNETNMDGLLLSNDNPVRGDNSGGTPRELLGVTASNRSFYGDISHIAYIYGLSIGLEFPSGSISLGHTEFSALVGLTNASTVETRLDDLETGLPTKADLNGDNTEVFAVGAPTTDDHAIRRVDYANNNGQVGGTVKMRYDSGTKTLYIRNDGTDA